MRESKRNVFAYMSVCTSEFMYMCKSVGGRKRGQGESKYIH